MLCLGSATYSAFMSLSGAAVGAFAPLAPLTWLLLPVLADGLEPSAGMSLSGALWFCSLPRVAAAVLELASPVLVLGPEFSSAVFSFFEGVFVICMLLSIGLRHGQKLRAQTRESRERLYDQAVRVDSRQEPRRPLEHGVALREVRQGGGKARCSR